MNNYREFLMKWIEKGYCFVNFGEKEYSNYQIIMRHDIDFDPIFALELAKIEKSLDISTTYFFLISSDSYNLLTPKNIETIKTIQSLGHTVSIHFDEVVNNYLWEDEYKKEIIKRLELELEFFQRLFGNINIISLHKPPNSSMNSKENFYKDIEHSYQTKYFKDMNYYSDSNNRWRFGSPVDSNEFKNGELFQVLTHPVWWTRDADSEEKIQNFYRVKYNYHTTDLLTPPKDKSK